MEVGNETVDMEALCAVEGENTLRRLGAGPFWEVGHCSAHSYLCLGSEGLFDTLIAVFIE